MTGQTCSFNHQTLFGRFPIKEWPEGRKSQHNFVPFIYERCERAISERCRFTLTKERLRQNAEFLRIHGLLHIYLLNLKVNLLCLFCGEKGEVEVFIKEGLVDSAAL